MGRRRKPGKYPYDYTDGDDRRFADSGVGGTLRVLHGPGGGMGLSEGVICHVEVRASDGHVLDVSEAGKLGKEHRLHATAPGDRVMVTVVARYADNDPALDELTATRDVVLTGDLDDVIRFGVGTAWDEVLAIDTGDLRPDGTPTAFRWGAGARIRGGRPTGQEYLVGPTRRRGAGG